MWCNGSILDLDSRGEVRVLHFQSRGNIKLEDGRAHNPEVVGSSPAPATHKKSKGNRNNATCSDKDTI